MTFSELQAEQRAWVQHNFPNRTAHMPLLGIAEETGELAHAHLKGEQGIRYSPKEVLEKKIDAIGDIVVFLADYCTANDIDFEDAVAKTWAHVMQRDWKQNPMDANKLVAGSL